MSARTAAKFDIRPTLASISPCSLADLTCQTCGHFDNADANASFNIAKREGICQLNADRDAFKGSTDTPRGATL